jgi:hypothetical protein
VQTLTLLLPLCKFEQILKKPPKGGFFYAVDNSFVWWWGWWYNTNIIIKKSFMTNRIIEDVVLTCDICGDKLNARCRLVESRRTQQPRVITRPELFCEACDKPFNMISRFKKQHAQKKVIQ